jgi:DNA-nicking Smr family endonuclease
MPRRRSLSAEDRQLWERVAASAVPLRPQPARPVGGAPPVPPANAEAAPRPLPGTAPRPAAARVPDLASFLDRAHPHMDSRRFEKLRRGRIEPEARLDLHGMTSERAHAALVGFLLGAHAAEKRLVLVITGKGRPDDSPHQPRVHGVLRHSLPHWLAQPPLAGRILQVAPAHPRHGGSGAFYVYLRRSRSA